MNVSQTTPGACDCRTNLFGGRSADVIARCQRAFDRENGEDVITNQRRKRLQFDKRKLRQIDTEFFRTSYGKPDSFVRIAEWQTLAGQVVRQVGGCSKALA